jgi:Domain of unknown function (DUF397)
VSVGDSKDPYGPALVFDARDWQRFVDRVRKMAGAV